MKRKYKVVKPSIDQDTKNEMNPGEIWEPSSEFELGRHLAEQNIVPVNTKTVERAVKEPLETRRRGRPRKVKDGV